MARKRKAADAWASTLYVCKSVTTGLPWGWNGPEPGYPEYTPKPKPPPVDESAPKVRRIDTTKRAA